MGLGNRQQVRRFHLGKGFVGILEASPDGIRERSEQGRSTHLLRPGCNTKAPLYDPACLYTQEVELVLVEIAPFGLEIDLLKAPKSAVGKITPLYRNTYLSVRGPTTTALCAVI